MAAHRYWRINVTASYFARALITEIQFRASIGGADETTGKPVTASSQFNASQSGSKAFDDSTATNWQSAFGQALPQWVRVDLGAGNEKDIVEYTIQMADNGTGGADQTGPYSWELQWSDDDAGWNTVDTQTEVPVWSDLETRVYSVAAGPVQVQSQHRALYAIRIGSAHRGVYAIRIGSVHRAQYQSLVLVASQHRALYALQAFDRVLSQHRARYAIKVASMHRAQYQSLVPVASMHRAVYGLLNRTISQHRARYAILDYDRLVSQHRAIYGLIGFVPVVSSGTITATVAGKTVPLDSVTIHADEDSPFWQAQISLHNPADYSRFPIDRAITVDLYGTVYALVVDTRSQPRAMDDQGNPTIEAQITALSPGAAYAFPRATPLTKTWTTPIYARAAVEEVLAQSVDWAILNWQIPAYRLAANESAPLDIARQIVEAAGAVLESKPDGSFRVRYRHPVAAPLYRSAVADYSIDEHEIYSVSDQGARARLINRLRLADLETVFQDRLEFIANPDDPQRGTIRAYPSPWRTAVRLRSTRNRPPVYVYRGVVRSRTETEAVEFREGRASVQYPITAINAVDWLDDSLGGVDFAAGSADLTVSGDGWSYAEITYATRAIEYPVYGKVGPGEELAAQFLLEDL